MSSYCCFLYKRHSLVMQSLAHLITCSALSSPTLSHCQKSIHYELTKWLPGPAPSSPSLPSWRKGSYLHTQDNPSPKVLAANLTLPSEVKNHLKVRRRERKCTNLPQQHQSLNLIPNASNSLLGGSQARGQAHLSKHWSSGNCSSLPKVIKWHTCLQEKKKNR